MKSWLEIIIHQQILLPIADMSLTEKLCILETRQNPPLTVQVAEQGGVGEVDLVPVVRVQSSSLILRLFIL